MSRVLEFTLLVVAVTQAFAQSGLQAPHIGYVRDSAGSIRSLIGVRGNFLLSEPILEQARSAAFSSSAGIVKTDGEILLLDRQEQVVRRIEAPAGAALFAFDATGIPAAAYLPETAEIYRFEGTEMVRLACDQVPSAGPVRAISSPAPGILTVAVERSDAMWLLSLTAATCETTSEVALQGVSASLVLQSGGTVIYIDGFDAVVRRADMSETRIPLEMASAQLEMVSLEWIHIRSDDGRSWALHVAPATTELFRIPGGLR